MYGFGVESFVDLPLDTRPMSEDVRVVGHETSSDLLCCPACELMGRDPNSRACSMWCERHGLVLSLPDRFAATVSDEKVLVRYRSSSDLGLIRYSLMNDMMVSVLRSRGIGALHGACLTKGTRTAVVLGASGAGKSTLTLRLLRDGWGVMSDDITPIRDGLVWESVPLLKASVATIQHCTVGSPLGAPPNSDARGAKTALNVRDHFVEGQRPLDVSGHVIDPPGAEKASRN